MAKKEKILSVFTETAKLIRPGEDSEKTGIDSKKVSKLIKVLKTDEKIYSTKKMFLR